MTEHIFRENAYWLSKEEFHFINELKKKEAGEKIEFENFHDAVEKLTERYKNDDFCAYCENVLPHHFKYEGKEIELCLVIGGEVAKVGNGYEMVCKSGIGHSYKNHGGKEVNGEIITVEKLKGAIKQLPKALHAGTQYNEYVLIKDEKGERLITRLLIDYNEFVYIIAFAEDESEINYLMNIFKPDKNYINRNLKNGNFIPIEKG